VSADDDEDDDDDDDEGDGNGTQGSDPRDRRFSEHNRAVRWWNVQGRVVRRGVVGRR